MSRLILLAVTLLLGCVTSFAQNALRVGSAAPAFSAIGMDGGRVDLSELRGSIVVLTFWSTRCIICQNEMPKLDQMMSRYSGSKVVFLSATPEDESRVKYYLSLNPVRSTVLPNSFGMLLQYADRDRDGTITMGYPAFFVVDADGSLQYRGSGYSKTKAVGLTVDRLLTK